MAIPCIARSNAVTRHFGTGAEMSGHFGTGFALNLVPFLSKCFGAEVSGHFGTLRDRDGDRSVQWHHNFVVLKCLVAEVSGSRDSCLRNKS